MKLLQCSATVQLPTWATVTPSESLAKKSFARRHIVVGHTRMANTPLLDRRVHVPDIQHSLAVLSSIAVCAALLATLTYQGVLTSPREVSDCQDICYNPQLDEIFSSTQNITSTLKNPGSVASPLTTMAGPSTALHAYQGKSLTHAAKTFMICNSLGLFFALGAVTLTIWLPLAALVKNKADALPWAIAFAAVFLLISIICCYVAFVQAHFLVFVLAGDQGWVGIVLIVLGSVTGGIALIICVVFALII